MRAARHAGFQRDPARIAAHDFDDHDAVMRFRRSVNLVHGIGSCGQGSIETESDFGCS